LAELAEAIQSARLTGDGNPEICGVAYDSRKVKAGDLFVAVKGSTSDGHRFISFAIEAGASAVLGEDELSLEVPYVQVTDSRRALGVAASFLMDHPSLSRKVMGITGTNGKTTTSFLLKSILEAAGQKPTLIGTVRYELEGEALKCERTTPEAPEIQDLIERTIEGGWVVMEASSHALALERLTGTYFDCAIFTNLTRDHLDFHRTFEEYEAAKTRLFESLDDSKAKGKAPIAVINVDDPAGARIAKAVNCRVVTYSASKGAEFVLESVEISQGRSTIHITGPQGSSTMRTSLVGEYNGMNVLAAYAAAVSMGLEPAVVERGIESLESVPGRVESIREAQDFLVVVDYAHTPEALSNLLASMRSVTPGRLIIVFGCGGDRDRGKRPLMAKAVADMSDLAIVTSDNPRTEDPEQIIMETLKGFEGTDADYENIADREEAIAHAIEIAKKNDCVVIAGKGHEDYQIVGDRILEFDDREVARKYLRRKAARSKA
jgi:UDP-N-acetylmuramoyl-L-alanyl-D-glutamate--2,6-diaminopimelate ligase